MLKASKTLLLFPLAALCSVMVACGGGSGGSSIAPPNVTAPTPAAPTAAPVATLTSFSVSEVFAAQPTAEPLPANAANVSGTITIPGGGTIPAGTQALLQLQATEPSGLPAPADITRRARAARRAPLREAAPITPLLFFSLAFSNTVSLPTPPTLSVALPIASAVNTAYFVGLFDPTRPSLGFIDRALSCTTASGSTLTLTCSGSGALTFDQDVTYTFVLYAIANTAPTPSPVASVPSVIPSTTPIAAFSPSPMPTQSLSPSPSPTPSPTPTGGFAIIITVPTPSPILCSPATVNVAVGKTVTIQCTAQDFVGTFITTVANPTIASVQPSSQQTQTFFDITGLAPGTTTFTLATKNGGTGSVSITVTPAPPPSPSPSPSPTPTPQPPPTPTPILCSPATVNVAVGKTVTIHCTSADFVGMFTTKVADPTIASVQPSSQQTQTFFDVTGLAPGTTTFTLAAKNGGMGSVPITVTTP